MAFTHVWNKLHLHRQKIKLAGILLLFLIFGSTAEAQRVVGLNKQGYDDKPVHYGFYLALPLTKYNLQHSQFYADEVKAGKSLAVDPKASIGFYTGLVLNVRLAEYLDARFVPGVGFYGRTIEFKNVDLENTEPVMLETINNTMVELPVLLKYKSKRRSNYRPYMVAGVKPALDLGKGNNGSVGGKDRMLEVNNFDVALEYGFGVDIFYPFFKFAPELRFSHGLIDQHKPVEEGQYSSYIKKLTNHNVSLILFFE